MSNEFNHIETFEAYYNNELSANAIIDFEERLESDDAFKNEYNLYLQLQLAINDIGQDQLKSTLDSFHEDHISKVKNSSTLKLKGYFGGLLLLFLIIGILVFSFPEETAQQRIEEHTAHVETNPNIEPEIISQQESVKKNGSDSTLPVTNTSQKINNKKVKVVANKVNVSVSLKKYKSPDTPLYLLSDSILHLYGFHLNKGDYILSEQNSLYLITPTSSFLLEKSHDVKALQQVKKRFYESAIKTKSQLVKVTKLHQVIFEGEADSLKLSYDKNINKNQYSFDGTTLTINNSLSTNVHQLISFNNKIYLLNSENLFQLNKGVDLTLKPATNAEKRSLKSTTQELQIVTETVEKTVEWENAN